MSKSLGDKSILAFFWVLVDKVGGSGINFLITILLARLLSPEDFGLIAMVMIFFEFSITFVESGFPTALIREKEISDLDKSTTFVFNLLTALLIYLILFFCAPMIAGFFKQDILVAVVRILALNLVIESFTIIQRATLTQQIDFKTQTKVRIPAILISGLTAVLLAWQGFGVYSLLAQILVKGSLSAVMLWMVCPWKISLRFSPASFRRLFGFGSKVLLDGIFEKFFSQLYKLLIGKFFSAATLGYFSQANSFVELVVSHLFWTFQRIIYPLLAKLQDDLERLRESYSMIVRLTSFLIFPAMILLGVLAEPVMLTLFGEKWLPAVPFLQLLCLASVTNHFFIINSNMLLVLGRPDLILMLSIFGYAFIVIAILIGVQYGVYGLVIGKVATSYVNLVVNTYYSHKLVGYSLLAQIRDAGPSIFSGLLMGGMLYLFDTLLPGGGLILLGAKCLSGGIFYLGLHYLIKSKELDLLQNMIIPKTIKLFSN